MFDLSSTSLPRGTEGSNPSPSCRESAQTEAAIRSCAAIRAGASLDSVMRELERLQTIRAIGLRPTCSRTRCCTRSNSIAGALPCGGPPERIGDVQVVQGDLAAALELIGRYSHLIHSELAGGLHRAAAG